MVARATTLCEGKRGTVRLVWIERESKLMLVRQCELAACRGRRHIGRA